MNRIGDNLICTGANEEIVRALNNAAVELLVVGGLAVAWYCRTREADDMDILVNPTHENSQKVFSALTGVGIIGIDVESFARTGVQAPLKQRHYADIITPARGGPSFDDLVLWSVDAKLFGMHVRIPSVSNLIKLKEHAATAADDDSDRAKHRHDISLLKGISE
jgi:hypothetical protein